MSVETGRNNILFSTNMFWGLLIFNFRLVFRRNCISTLAPIVAASFFFFQKKEKDTAKSGTYAEPKKYPAAQKKINITLIARPIFLAHFLRYDKRAY